jgi:hypothetical protein
MTLPPMMMGPGHGLPFTLAGEDAKHAAAPFRPHLHQQHTPRRVAARLLSDARKPGARESTAPAPSSPS